MHANNFSRLQHEAQQQQQQKGQWRQNLLSACAQLNNK